VLHEPILAMCAAVIVFAMLRFSIALMMFGCGLVYLWVSRQDIGLIVDQTLNSSFQLSVLLAIPMFILAGNVMNAATISERIWGAADAMIGRWRAGLGHVTVLMNVVISSMSGSAVSDAAGAGMVAIQMMRKVGRYPGGLAVAITAAASCLGPIIPPSIPMVIYAILSGVSVGALFLSGVIPGLLMAVSLMLLIAWIGRRRNLPYGGAVAFVELPRVLGRALLPLSLPVVLLGGIWGGVFTPTEAAAVSAVYAFVITVFVYGDLKLKDVPKVLLNAANLSAMLLYIITNAVLFSFLMTHEQIPQTMAAWIMDQHFGVWTFLLVVNVILLLAGNVMEPSSILLIMAPIIFPMAVSLGINPTHLGILMAVNMEVGLCHPPVGLNLYVGSGIAKMGISEMTIAVLPWLGAMLIFLIIITYVPEISLWLPQTLGIIR
jgi:C4-dicarboxylate transporter DctM subunit